MKIVRLGLLLLLALSALTFGTLVRSRQIEHRFARLHLAQPQSQVREIMGRSPQTHACTPAVQQAPDCATELLYAHPLSPLIPEYWIVSLDKNSRVVALIHTTTP